MTVNSDLLVSDDELERITGYKRPRDQLKYLREKLGLTPFVSARGQISLYHCVLQDAQRLRSGLALQEHSKPRAKPRLERVK